MGVKASRVFQLHKRQRFLFAEKFIDLANLAAASLIFSQFVVSKTFELSTFTIGAIIVLILYLIGYKLTNA